MRILCLSINCGLKFVTACYRKDTTPDGDISHPFAEGQKHVRTFNCVLKAGFSVDMGFLKPVFILLKKNNMFLKTV